MKYFWFALLVAALAVVLSDQKAAAFDPYASKSTPISVELLASSITATGPTGANTVMTFTRTINSCHFENTTNVELQTTFNGVKHKRLPAGQVRVFDLGSNSNYWPSGTVIGVFYTASSPSSGVLEIVCNPSL